MFKKIIKNFKKDSQAKVYHKEFRYTLNSCGTMTEYKFKFDTTEAEQNDTMLRICYDEFVKRHGEDAVDNIVKVAIV